MRPFRHAFRIKWGAMAGRDAGRLRLPSRARLACRRSQGIEKARLSAVFSAENWRKRRRASPLKSRLGPRSRPRQSPFPGRGRGSSVVLRKQEARIPGTAGAFPAGCRGEGARILSNSGGGSWKRIESAADSWYNGIQGLKPACSLGGSLGAAGRFAACAAGACGPFRGAGRDYYPPHLPPAPPWARAVARPLPP